MNINKNIKILIVTHKPVDFPKGKYFVPIHAGRDVALNRSKDGLISKKDFSWLCDNTIGDNTGDNISIKNRYYNELSALYWAWKNYDKLGNPDYIGLMHYRRHFVFNEEYYKKKISKETAKNQGFSVISEKYFDEEYANRIGLCDKNIECMCEQYDAIVSYPSHLSLSYGKHHTLRTDYIEILRLKAKDLDLMVNILKRKYPNFADKIEDYVNNDQKLEYQMFIMKKELFFEYCDFLFGILFEIEKQVNFEEYTIREKRTLGYLGEIMMSLFFIINADRGLKIKNCGISFIECENAKHFYKRYLSRFMKNIFSLRNSDNRSHKIITVLGVKIKLKK